MGLRMSIPRNHRPRTIEAHHLVPLLSELADYRNHIGTVMFLPVTAKTTPNWESWLDLVHHNATQRTSVADDHLQNSGIDSGFRMDPWRRLETCLSELVDYRRIHGTTVFLTNGAKTRTGFYWASGQRKEYRLQPCRKDIAHDRLRIQVGRHRVF
jgi:hypothetical protein